MMDASTLKEMLGTRGILTCFNAHSYTKDLNRKLEFMELFISALTMCDCLNGRVRSRFNLKISGFGVDLIDQFLLEARDYECVRYEMPEEEILRWMIDQDFKLEFLECDFGLGEEEFAILVRADSKEKDELLIQLRWWGEGLGADEYLKTF